MMPLGDVVHGGDARAAAHADDGPVELMNLCGPTERSADVADGISGLQGIQMGRGLAEDQVDQGDGAGFGVGIGDGQGNALPVLPDPKDDEISRSGLGRDLRGLDDQLGGGPEDEDRLRTIRLGIRPPIARADAAFQPICGVT